LVNYAVFQYAVPEAAAEAVGRNDLISMIAVANKAGGGQSVANTEYLYIKELKGILEPAVSLFKQEDDPLYLVRGQGTARQVYDKLTDKWHNLEQLKRQHAKEVADTRAVASAAADTVSSHPSFNQPTEPAVPAKPTLSDAVMDVITNAGLKRADLAKFAGELGIDDGTDVEVYATNKDLIAKITEVNEANKKG
ncbi:hypothetical protein HZA56_13945, partial [Candidatus Poribacteria bacterium]|nr:hypothetical protein [Candidatus Poribacteria bacterium]